MNNKKGILIVSSGTSHLDTLKKTIVRIEQDARERFPGCKVYRAFTSQIVLNKLKKTENLHFYNIEEALKQMAEDGIEVVVAQPTYVINGIENDRMMSGLLEHAGRFRKIRVGKPLLSSAEDYKKAIHVIMAEVELKAGEMLILMGHGTDHHANSAYPTLEYTFHALGYKQMLIGTVGSFPGIRNVMAKLEVSNCKKIVLRPFLIVAGSHAKNDMAGNEGSWKTKLEEAGYEVDVIMKGLGELKGIRNIFMEHIEEVI